MPTGTKPKGEPRKGADGKERLIELARQFRPQKKARHSDAWPPDLVAELDEVIRGVIAGSVRIAPTSLYPEVRRRLIGAGVPAPHVSTLINYWNARKEELSNAEETH